MSGGTAVKAAGSGGGSPVLHEPKRGRTGKPLESARREAKGLALTEDGDARPPNKKESVSPSGLATDAQGMEAVFPRPRAGSVHDSPPRRGAVMTVI